MFSDSRAPGPGEQKAFQPHGPHFIPWLRNSLRSHHGGDLGLGKACKSNSEARNHLASLERPRGIGFFSFPGKERGRKGDFRCNGVAMARMLPVVLRGPHILPGNMRKRTGSGPDKPDPDPDAQINPGDGPQGPVSGSASAQDNHSLVTGNQSSLPRTPTDGPSTSARKYGPLAGPPLVPAPPTEEPNIQLPLVEDSGGKAWDYERHGARRQRDVHSSSWASPDAQGLGERQRRFSSGFSHVKQSQRDLTQPPVEAFAGLNGLVFSTEVPSRGAATLWRPRRPRASSGRTAAPDRDRTASRHGGESQGQETGCGRKAVRDQIQRVVENLEQVLTALRDVQQEMKEVVQQIDYLTSSIDLNEGGQQQGTRRDHGAKPLGSSRTTIGGGHHPSEPEGQPRPTDSSGSRWPDHHSESQSPTGVQLCPVSSQVSSERGGSLRFGCSMGSSPTGGGPLRGDNAPNPVTSYDLSPAPQRSLPVRPPTPGLSPLNVHLQPPRSPDSPPRSPSSSTGVSLVPPPSPHPPPALSPSVIIETKVGSHPTSQSDHPSPGPLSTSSTQPPSAGGPPAKLETQTVSGLDEHRQASSAELAHPESQVCAASAAKPQAAQGRRGRRPPPYPHHRLSEHKKKARETRKAPPYPEKRRLLSTTV